MGNVTRRNFAEVVAKLNNGDFDPDEQGMMLGDLLEMLSEYVTTGKLGADGVAAHFDRLLEGWAKQGAFGHERQRDPRQGLP